MYNHKSPTLTPEPFTRGHKIHNFGKGILPYHNYVLSSLAKYPVAEKTIFKELMHSQYMTIRAPP